MNIELIFFENSHQFTLLRREFLSVIIQKDMLNKKFLLHILLFAEKRSAFNDFWI